MERGIRLPLGFARLKSDLGGILGAARRSERIKQQSLAEDVAIARETLSRIETGRTLPRPDTLDRLMAVLELDWDDVAERGESERPARRFDDSFEGDWRLALGRHLRVARKERGMSLRGLSRTCGLSAAQLSRIERGEPARGRAFTRLDGGSVVFGNAVLAQMIALD